MSDNTRPTKFIKLAPKPSVTKDYRDILDHFETAVIERPLSESVNALLAKHSDGSLPLENKLGKPSKALSAALKKLVWDSELVDLPPIHASFVYKCSPDIIVKVRKKAKLLHTECSSLEYLEMNAPTIPAPRSHGLISFGDDGVCQALFMTYIPGISMEKVFPRLSHEDKLSIQHKLDSIICHLKTFQQDDGKPLGGVGGEGVVTDRFSIYKGTITTVAEYTKLLFSADTNPRGKFFYSLLEHDDSITSSPVFTHGDLQLGNIMVQQAGSGYTLSGLIDWELSGFYPSYVECIGFSRSMFISDWDWYKYYPECIAPKKFFAPWLLDTMYQKLENDKERWHQLCFQWRRQKTCLECRSKLPDEDKSY